MARSPRDDRDVEAAREALRREDETVRHEPAESREESPPCGPERPDVPLGVPADADTDERPGFPRDDPSHG